jgi:hypothetical protein
VVSLKSAKTKKVLRDEAAFQRWADDFATLQGWWCWHAYDPRRSRAGLPDLVCVKDRVVWIELKVYYESGKGQVRTSQTNVHQMLREAGQEIHVVYDDSDGRAFLVDLFSGGRLTVNEASA